MADKEAAETVTAREASLHGDITTTTTRPRPPPTAKQRAAHGLVLGVLDRPAHHNGTVNSTHLAHGLVLGVLGRPLLVPQALRQHLQHAVRVAVHARPRRGGGHHVACGDNHHLTPSDATAGTPQHNVMKTKQRSKNCILAQGEERRIRYSGGWGRRGGEAKEKRGEKDRYTDVL